MEVIAAQPDDECAHDRLTVVEHHAQPWDDHETSYLVCAKCKAFGNIVTHWVTRPDVQITQMTEKQVALYAALL
jgi:hypothetical protein